MTVQFAGDAADAASFASGTVNVGQPAIVTTTATTAQVTTVSATQTVTTTTTATSSTSTAVPRAQPASLCGAVTVDLLDIYARAGRVHLLGYANPMLAGRTVSIVSAWNGKVAAGTRVGSDGYFTATAPLPPASLRGSNRARYEARAGGATSPAVKFSRRIYVFAVTAIAGGRVRITGQVSGTLAAPITVTRRLSCAMLRYQTLKASVKVAAGGTFTAVAPAPPSSAPGAVYLLRTRVRPSKTSRASFATNTLPRAVGH